MTRPLAAARRRRAAGSTRAGEHADIVLSTRIRLARNVAGYAFTARARDGERLRVLAQVREAMPRVPSAAPAPRVLRLDETGPRSTASCCTSGTW